MANWFKEIGKGIEGLLKHPIDEAEWMLKETKGVVKPLLKGDVSESWDSFKGSFGRHNDMMSENIAKPLLGDNKLTRNPDAAAGAIIGSIFAAPLIGGAMGGGASAGAGAPVSSAVGMTPAEAILAGGGNVAEVGSVSTSGAFNRFGKVAMDMGKGLFNDSSAPSGTTTTTWTGNRSSASAPSFQAYNRPVIDQMLAEEASNTGALNLDPFGFGNT